MCTQDYFSFTQIVKTVWIKPILQTTHILTIDKFWKIVAEKIGSILGSGLIPTALNLTQCPLTINIALKNLNCCFCKVFAYHSCRTILPMLI